MTSFPEFGDATTATEVANAFSEQIRGKNGVHTLLFSKTIVVIEITYDFQSSSWA